MSLSKYINPSLVLAQPMKTRPLIAERLLIGRKESNQTKFNYLEIELHTRHVGSPVMLWNHIRAKDYNKSTIIKKKIFATSFSNINPDEHASTKVNTSSFYKGAGSGSDSPLETKELKKSNEMKAFPLW